MTNQLRQLTVIIPAHNPHRGRLERTLMGLKAQSLPAEQWETILIDNASSPALSITEWAACAPAHFRIVAESTLGLSHARECGFKDAQGGFAVLVDDDNVLASDYLENVLKLFTQYPRIGALGGRSLPEFETTPPDWTMEFYSLLALRDLGTEPLISSGLRPSGSPTDEYPLCAPIGAGMALRRSAWTAWLEARSQHSNLISDRRGNELTSGGDNDIVLCLMRAGWDVGYFPRLSLTHLIPPGRLEKNYLARLNRGIARSWVRVLAHHEIRPWPPVAPATVWLRQWRAWWRARAWRNDAAWVRWQGACGAFEGQADLAQMGRTSIGPRSASNP